MINFVAKLECLKVPADDKFQILNPHSAQQIVKPQSYLDIEYTDEFVVIQITLNEGRKTDVKKSFDAMVADLLRGNRRNQAILDLLFLAGLVLNKSSILLEHTQKGGSIEDITCCIQLKFMTGRWALNLRVG
jgi:16S rRNA U516 pseudouridylate synthase RsuA-like enzyme